MDLIWVMFAFFILVTVLFVVLAFSFPEWFGITGQKALDIQKHQTGNDEKASDKSKESEQNH